MKLTVTQQKLVDKVRATGGTIQRMRGGFWTQPSPAVDERGVPSWWFGTQTIDALIKRNVLTVTVKAPGGAYNVVCRLNEEALRGHS